MKGFIELTKDSIPFSDIAETLGKHRPNGNNKFMVCIDNIMLIETVLSTSSWKYETRISLQYPNTTFAVKEDFDSINLMIESCRSQSLCIDKENEH